MMENFNLKHQLAAKDAELTAANAFLHGLRFEVAITTELYHIKRDELVKMAAELAAAKEELADTKRESSELMERFQRESRSPSPPSIRSVADAKTNLALARRKAYEAAALRDELRARTAKLPPQRMSLAQGITGTPGATS
jgi:paraquat-inducible protein B